MTAGLKLPAAFRLYQHILIAMRNKEEEVFMTKDVIKSAEDRLGKTLDGLKKDYGTSKRI